MVRQFRPTANARWNRWRKWQTFWTYANVTIGGLSAACGALVAAYSKELGPKPEWYLAVAVAAPVLTFILASLRPQAKALAYEMAARELEKGLAVYDADPEADDIALSGALCRGIDALNKATSA